MSRRSLIGICVGAAVWTLASASTSLAEIPPELRGRPVVSVEIAGAMRGRVSPREVGIFIGAPLGRRMLRAAVMRLIESGRWADVQLEAQRVAGGARVIAHLVPRLLIVRLDIDGNDIVDDDRITRALGLSAGSDVERAQLPELGERVEGVYAPRGYHGTEIDIRLLETDDPSRVVLSLDIDEGRPTRIAAIRFLGDDPPRGVGLSRAMEIEEGDILDRQAVERSVEAAEKRLREQGYLEAIVGPVRVHREEDRAEVRIHSRVGRRFQVAIRGNPPLERDEVLAVLSLGTEPLNRALAEAMEARVRDLYHRFGFPRAEVRIRRLALPEEGQAQLLIEIETGSSERVAHLRLQGARFFDASFLRTQFETVLEEALGREGLTQAIDREVIDRLVVGRPEEAPRRVAGPGVVPPEEVFYPSAYADAIEHIEELYEAEGFLGARIGPHRKIPIPGEERVFEVVIPIHEGPRTRLHSLELLGVESLSTREVVESTRLRRGQPFSFLALEEAERALLDLYQDHGYLYAAVESDVRFSRDGTRAEVEIRIEERFEVFVGEIRVEGLERTRERMVRDLIALEPGGLYRPALARRTQERLMELGIFRSVTVIPDDAELPARVKAVVVTVTERPPQFLDFLAGLSTAEGVRGAMEYGYRNLGGWAMSITFRVQLAAQFFFLDDTLEARFEALSLLDRLERRVTLGLLLPYLPGLDDTRASIAVSHQRENERNFGLDKNQVEVTVGYRPTRWFTASLSPGVENNNVDLLVDDETYDELLASTTDPRLKRLLRVPEGQTTLVAVAASASVDFRDNPFAPTRGAQVTLTTEWARSIVTENVEVAGEEQDFFSHHIRGILSVGGYAPLGSGVVLASQGRIGRVFHLRDRSETYPNRQFFLGGVDTMRAFRQDAMVPQDLADEIASDPNFDPNAVVQGGDTFLLVRTELRFPIAGDFAGGVFAELGNLWVDPAQINPLELRPTAGLGLRIATPVGPIALDYGFNFLYRRPDRRPLDESIGAFNFSIGLF